MGFLPTHLPRLMHNLSCKQQRTDVNNPVRTPVLIIMENADNLTLGNIDAQHKSRVDLNNLAAASAKSQDFMLVLLFQDAYTVKNVYEWNPTTKMPLSPTFDQMASVQPTDIEIDTVIDAQRLELCAEDLAQFRRLAKIARSVGFVATIARKIRNEQQRGKRQVASALRSYRYDASVHKSDWDRWRKQWQCSRR